MELNLIDINKLPDAKTLLSSDKIYVFTNISGNTYTVDKVKISDLSAYFINQFETIKLYEKYKELLELSAQFIKFMDDNYTTRDYANANYSTPAYFKSVYAEINTIDSIKNNQLEDYATIEYENLMKETAFKNHESYRFETSKIRNDIIGSLDT